MQFGSRCLVFPRLACDRSCPGDEVPCPVSYFRGGKGGALPRPIYIYICIYTYVYCFLFILVTFLSSHFLFSLDLPTANLYSFVRCSFATLFFKRENIRLRSAGPSFPPLFSFVVKLAFAPRATSHSCVRAWVYICVCVCACVSFFSAFLSLIRLITFCFRSVVHFLQRLAADRIRLYLISAVSF